MLKKTSKFFRLTSLVLVLLMTLTVFVSCAEKQDTTATTTPAATTAGSAATTAPTATAVTFSGKIQLGGTVDLTSSSGANAGLEEKEGMTLAVKEINAAGGVLGKELVIDIQDNQGTADGASLAVEKLISEKVVAIIGPMISTQCLAVNESLLKAKMVTLFGGTNKKLSLDQLQNPYVFMMRPNDTLAGANVAKYMVDTLKAKKVGIFFNNDDFGTGGKDVIASYLDSVKVPYVTQGINTNDKDATGQILALKNAGCDVVALWGHGTETALFATTYKNMGFDPKVVSCTTATASDFLALINGPEISGWYSVGEFSPDSTDAVTQKIVANSKAAWNLTPSMNYVSFYGGVYILADAIKRANSTDAEAIKTALIATKNLNAAYTYTCDSQHRMVHRNIIVQMDDKKTAHTIGTVDAEIK